MYQKIKAMTRRAKIVMSVLTIIILIFVALWIHSADTALKEAAIEISVSVIFSAITVLLLCLMRWIVGAKDIEDEHDKDTARRIWGLLRAEKAEDSIIRQLYDREAAYLVMRNSISCFSSRLSDSFCKLVDAERSVIRENFTYRVKIFLDNKTGQYSIRQNIKYIRHFMHKSDAPIYLKTGFAFNENGLNALMSDNSFFFREQFDDINLIKTLKDAAVRNDCESIINCLSFSIQLFKGKEEVNIENSKIELETAVENGILTAIILKYRFPPEYIDGENAFIQPSLDGKLSYAARIKCFYPTPKTSKFMCVFADPIIGTTNYSLEFDEDILDDVRNDAQTLKFLTIPNLKEQKITTPDNYEIFFETSETIFPISAIVTYWDAKK